MTRRTHGLNLFLAIGLFCGSLAMPVRAWPAPPSFAPQVLSFLASARGEHLQVFEKTTGYSLPSTVKAYALSAEDEETLAKALASLPMRVTQLLQEHVSEVVFAQGLDVLGVSGFVGKIGQNREFILLDVSVLHEPASQRLARRERGFFSPSAHYSLEVELSGEQDFLVEKNGFIQILLHELGHVLHQKMPIFPENEDNRLSARSRAGIVGPFGTEVVDKASSILRRYFFSPESSESEKLKPSITKAGAVFLGMENSGLVSLYSTVSPYEDFAETFAAWVYCVHMKRHYRIEVKRAHQSVWSFAVCHQFDRHPERAALFEKQLASALGAR